MTHPLPGPGTPEPDPARPLDGDGSSAKPSEPLRSADETGATPTSPGPAAPGGPATSGGLAPPGGLGPPGGPATPGVLPPPGAYGHPLPGPPGHLGTPVYPGAWPGVPQPEDGLVTPPYAGFSGWWQRLLRVFRASVGPISAVLLLVQFLPAMVLMLLLLVAGVGVAATGVWQSDRSGELAAVELAVVLAVALLAAVVLVVGSCVGTAASYRIALARALGEPMTIAGGLRYGLRRWAGVLGWSLVAGGIALAGLLLCVLPVFYATFALSLLMPAYLCERGNPVVRSWRLTHARFGEVLGRVAVTFGLALAGSAVISCLAMVLQLPLVGLSVAVPDAASASAAAQFALSLGLQLLTLPVAALLTVGPLLTYAEARAAHAPVTGLALREEMER